MALGYCDSVGVALGYCDSVGVLLGNTEMDGAFDGLLDGCILKLGSSEGDEEVDGLSEGSLVIAVFPSVIADTPYTFNRRQRIANAILFVFIVCALIFMIILTCLYDRAGNVLLSR